MITSSLILLALFQLAYVKKQAESHQRLQFVDRRVYREKRLLLDDEALSVELPTSRIWSDGIVLLNHAEQQNNTLSRHCKQMGAWERVGSIYITSMEI